MALRLLHVTDTHLRAVADPAAVIDPEAQLASLLGMVNSPVDVVVHTGDIADDASLEATRRVAELLGGLGCAQLGVPGNHDDPAIVAEVFSAPRVDVCGWRVLGINSVIPQRVDGAVDPDALAALLDADADATPTVLAIHHPLMSNSTHRWFQLDGAEALADVLNARPHVRAVLSGHTHEPLDRTLPSGCRLLGGPSSYYAIRHVDDRYERAAQQPAIQLVTFPDDGPAHVQHIELPA